MCIILKFNALWESLYCSLPDITKLLGASIYTKNLFVEQTGRKKNEENGQKSFEFVYFRSSMNVFGSLSKVHTKW